MSTCKHGQISLKAFLCDLHKIPYPYKKLGKNPERKKGLAINEFQFEFDYRLYTVKKGVMKRAVKWTSTASTSVDRRLGRRPVRKRQVDVDQVEKAGRRRPV